ncbi:MAG: hypothetical protein BZY80_05610 [SAR202 cluster bacterium Io17-Chloro-G2]|nr:MAG: hypothetical protein BZY80_05610 [SAR202 cluster bacterium Io17-Chloro-G2]
MSKFLDYMERITLAGPGGMGFGAARTGKTPAMALIGLVSGSYAKGLGTVSKLALDAALMSGIDNAAGLKRIEKSLPSMPWGVKTSTLTEESARGFRDGGCDLLAFALENTAASALATDDAARILYIDAEIEERELRAIGALPVDALILPMTEISGPWELANLASVASISRRVDKYILVEVGGAPSASDLESLRNAGVHGLVLDVAAVGAHDLETLKSATLDMPRQRPPGRGRASAIVPSSVFPSGAGPQREEEDEEEDDDDI